jgi:hypothetical protein
VAASAASFGSAENAADLWLTAKAADLRLTANAADLWLAAKATDLILTANAADLWLAAKAADFRLIANAADLWLTAKAADFLTALHMQRVGFGNAASRFEVIKVRADFEGLKNQIITFCTCANSSKNEDLLM